MSDSLHYGNRGGSNWAVQVAKPLEMPEAALPVDPWLLGYWLGDGHKATATIATAEEEVLARIRALGYRVTHYARFNYGISTGDRGGAPRPSLKGDLRELGVIGNKHIPITYLRASRGSARSCSPGCWTPMAPAPFDETLTPCLAK